MTSSPILGACTQLVLLLKHVQDKSFINKLERPMSKKARRLLFGLIEGTTSYAIVHTKIAARVLVDSYNVLKLEEAVHKYDPDVIIKSIPKKVKTETQYKYYISLECIDDPVWLEDNDPSLNRNKVGMLNSPEATSIYEWATGSFLLSDFNEQDLNKIVHMGSGIYDINTIMAEGAKIKDIDKRSISYLYAIVRDAAIRQHSARQREIQQHNQNAEKLANIINKAINVGETVAYEPTERDVLIRARLFAEIARSIKD